jgi:hypothetical protein
VTAVTWPPRLADLKADMNVPGDQDDALLQANLDAAVGVVERVRSDVDYGAYPLPGAKVPSADLKLGTIRLAARWFTRRRSPEALLDMAELGSARVPSFDADIDRLLRTGRYARAILG